MAKGRSDSGIRERIKSFVNAEDTYDLCAYMYWYNGIARSLQSWMTIIKQYCDEKTYDKICKKVYPFSYMKNPDEVKSKVIRLVKDKKMTLIDIIDELGCSVNQFAYLVKVLKDERRVSQSDLLNSTKLTELWYSYNKGAKELTIDFPNVTIQDLEKVKNIVYSRGLELNDITYYQAFKYALKNDIIKLQKNILR